MSDTNAKKGLTFHDVDPSFIPYACHIDPETILTKNGNLMQTIKITGFTFELVGAKEVNLRNAIRNAIKKHIPNDSFAIWTHTIRRKKNLSLNSKYDNNFCNSLDQAWGTLHDWSQKYVNELFITIITEGRAYKPSKVSNIAKAISFTSLKMSEKKFINNNLESLTQVTNKFLEELKDFGARKLTMFKMDDKYHSEPLRFLGKILNLEEIEFPVKEQDLSEQLPYCKIAFGKNMFEVYEEGRKHFATIFSIKEYNELTLKSLDKFLLLPIEFIVSQTLDFINSDKALEEFKEQDKILQVSKDTKFADLCGITEIMGTSQDNETSFGEHQITLMLIADSKKELEKTIEKTTSIFFGYGLVIVREDLFMENCYWSQLPGNFYYITRRKPINTARFAGFASLSNFPAGKSKGNKWGDAVTIFYTQNKTPYFFNFHHEDNGHTMIIGPYGTGKTVLLNFLIAQSMKFKPRIIYIDFFNSSEIFVKALGGKYLNLDLQSKQQFFNPAGLFKDDPEFIKRFLSYLMIQKTEITEKGYKQDPNKTALIEKIATNIQNGSVNKLEQLASHFSNTDLAKFFSLWVGKGKLAHIFDNAENILDNENIIGINISDLAEQKVLTVPVTYYLMHYLEKSLDGKPTIFVLDEAFKLLDNPFLAGDLHNFFARLKQNNCVAILASESIDDAKNSSITNLLTKEISTQIFLPNEKAGKEYQSIFQLNKDEATLINKISNDARHFMLKHGSDSIIAELDLGSLEHIISVLSSNEYSIKVMEQVISRAGEDPNKWVPAFQEIVTEVLDEELDINDASYGISDTSPPVEDDAEVEDYSYENAASQEEQEKITKEGYEAAKEEVADEDSGEVQQTTEEESAA